MTGRPIDSFAQYQTTKSPLLLSMHDPVIHQLISYLAQKKAEQEANPESHVSIELSRELITKVRESFSKGILNGERHLHTLTHLLASLLLTEGGFELHSNVIGILPHDDDRPFLIRERITRDTLLALSDIDLGNHMLDRFRYQKDRSWVPLKLSANFVEYVPLGRPESGVNRITSRVKAEEELWNKVTDEIFAIDELVYRDKQLRQYSKYVKDIFGIKIVCENDEACLKVHEALKELTWNKSVFQELETFGEFVELDETCSGPLLEFIETKDYLTCPQSMMKKTGWMALKSVARWKGRLFEIQIQPLGNYYLELDHMSGPSHRSFKIHRDTMRDDLANRLPLYGFYRDLLKMLFIDSAVSFECKNASVMIS